MKYLLTLSLVCLLAFGAYADDHKDKHDMKSDKSKTMNCELAEGETCTAVKVPGAQCGMCVETIESAVQDVTGVTMAKVDLENKVAHVHLDKEKTSVKKVEKAIAEAGYDANDTKRNEKKHAKLPACCQSK